MPADVQELCNRRHASTCDAGLAKHMHRAVQGCLGTYIIFLACIECLEALKGCKGKYACLSVHMQ